MSLRELVIVFTSALLVQSVALAQSSRRPHAEDHQHGHQHTDDLTPDGVRIIPPADDGESFHFAIYGDRTGGVPAGLKVLEQAVADTNLLDPDLVMTVGDLIQGYNEKPEWMKQMREFKDIMSKLRMAWFPVAGNHDIYWRGPGQAPEGHHENNYRKHFGPLWYSFRHKNCGFIVLYSDEGDRTSNRKGFNSGELQMMSNEQLAFLDKALRELESADHIFLFLHHPRWLGRGYTGSNWNVVDEKLRAAGNVTAVFAGHIHQMTYSRHQDDIEYYTLATTGGHLSADIPGAGYLHHLNLVTVRKERISVATIPVGAVVDPKEFTKQFLAEITLARSIRPQLESPHLLMAGNGAVDGKVEVTLTNPSPRLVETTLSFGSETAVWTSDLDHSHLSLEPNSTETVRFRVKRQDGELDDPAIPVVSADMVVVADSSRIQLPQVSRPIGVRPDRVPTDYFANASDRCLRVDDERAAIRVDADEIPLPDGPMTLEAWVRADQLNGFNGIIAKTQSSEYAFFSDEGVPQFDIHLDGQYVTVTGKDKLVVGEWTHLAGVYDGQSVTLFVNGKLVGQKAGSGQRGINKLPLYIGADPDTSGRPTRAFRCSIDEVRLSSRAVYASEFTPARRLDPTDSTHLLLHLDRNLGPFVLDRSPSAATAVLGSRSALIAP